MPKILTIILVFIAIAATTLNTYAQVDPSWLKSWTESKSSRPVILLSKGRIAQQSEPGNPLIVHGHVVSPDGSSAPGVVVLVYHRDHDGFDFGPNDNSLSTWRIQGWLKTDEDGRFEFQTIRPAHDHLGREGAHIHFTVESERFGRQWAPTVFFADDPLVTPEQRRRSSLAGDFGPVREVTTKDDVQYVDVKIKLKATADF